MNRTLHWNAYWAEHQAWQVTASQIPSLQLQQMQAHQAVEEARQAELAEARRIYEAQCAARQAEVDQSNVSLDQLIAGLQMHAESAVQEYVAIVLGNSVYPDGFPVEHDFDFDQELRELALRVTIPGPDEVPTVKAYKYTKASDEITSTALPQKQLKDRYASAVHQVAVRSIHEVFEADHHGAVQTISLQVGADSIDPAIGQVKHTSLVAVAVDRDTFTDFDLSLVVPQATLEHLGAVMSKNPFGLVAIDTSKGVRGT